MDLKALALGALVVLSVPVTGYAATAAFMDCAGINPDITFGFVDNAYDCQISNLYDQDYLNKTPITVNDGGGFFGYQDWVYGDREEISDSGGRAGTYDFGSAEPDKTYMLIFKSGNDTTLVGYLINAVEGFLTGTWYSPFTNPPFTVDNTKDVSHITLYSRDGVPPPIPLPASALLLLGGLGGLAVMRRRKKA